MPPPTSRPLGLGGAISRSVTLPRRQQVRVITAATTTALGSVLIAGGLDSDGEALTGAGLIDLATGTVTPAADMTKPGALHTASLLEDAQVLFEAFHGLFLVHGVGP